MTTHTGTRVLISGASFAGLASAFWMRRLGYQVTVVELGPGLKRGGTPVDIRDETIGVVDRMGLLDAVRAKALPPRTTVFTTLDGTELARSEPEPPTTDATGDGYEIHRDDLLDILAAATEGDVEMLWGSSVDALTDTGNCVRASFRDGTVRDFDLVLGCDGVHSTVRRLWFGPESEYDHFLGTYFSVAVVDETFIAPGTTTIANAPGLTAMLNSYDTTTDIVLAFRSDSRIAYDHRDVDEQRRILREQLRSTGAPLDDLVDRATRASSFYFDELTQIRMPRWTSGRVALVGDAGYSASPAAGMGGSLAILGATALFDALASSGGDVEGAFAESERSFRPVAEHVQHEAEHVGVPTYFPATSEELEARNASLLG